MEGERGGKGKSGFNRAAHSGPPCGAGKQLCSEVFHSRLTYTQDEIILSHKMPKS